ncbi:synaptonemal complex central element protein 2 isoform X2 [Anguilla anguilla]|uniref:Synaptonemal complex central element protein 2 n=2 Tax=Anguilla anguilla TaxID=7936 RepID=A0A9D3LM53_ANGAN|nr:synaptonemal complex central element protein 2 isoform X2 [Anguilla anguilla]KAG5832836.1 hypothetical protein ANANG_G00295430 [Anguilla anguilla]
MAEFFGMLGSTSQSTPKPRDTSTSQAQAEGPSSDLDSRGESGSFGSLDESYEQHVSDDSGIGVCRRELDAELKGGDSAYFSALSSRVDQIGRRAQDLVEKINKRRATDQEVMHDFQEKLTKKVSEVCQQVKEQMFSSYEANGRLMESRLLELSEVLGRSSQLIADLQGASQTLAAINKGLCKTPEQ